MKTRSVRIILATLLAMAMQIGMMTADVFAGDAPATQYVDKKWENGQVVDTTKTQNDVAWMTDGHLNWHDGWWYTRDMEKLVISDRVSVDNGATANLILMDGKTIEFENGIHVGKGSTLNIYGQAQGTGKLVVGKSEADTAAIGGNAGESNGTINIYGGTIQVTGGSHSSNGGAGIGAGGTASNESSINIYGGTITSTGGANAAGIGGGARGGHGGEINIYGGKVTANGDSGAAGIGGGEGGSGTGTFIHGGEVHANGGSTSSDGGAGIGSGNKNGKDGVVAGNVYVYGGKVYATGGADAAGIGGGNEVSGGIVEINGVNGDGAYVEATSKTLGAGIGGGQKGDGGTVVIRKGTVIATGGADGAGIGGGEGAAGGNITISNGTVTAEGGGDGAGIGGGDCGEGGTITISGGNKITATGGANGAGIGGGNERVFTKIEISGGTIEATGGDYAAGIGSGDRDTSTNGGTINISGGNVTAKGGTDAAGIGGGETCSGGTINITGGTVTAKGGDNGAGIGGGDCGEGGTITISGGNKITATGGANGAGIGGGNAQVFTKIEISGGTIEATGGGYAAGIGSGDTDTSTDGGTINISGGNVTAKGGTDAAGIGGGETCSGGSITITDGEINATGGLYGAGIGSGDGGSNGSGNITIKGGKITATGGEEAAGIGGGNQSGVDNQGTIDISGGTIIANGGKLGAGIGGGDGQKGGTINISGGDISAKAGIRAAGIGGGDGKDGGNITISGGKVSASGGSHGGDIGDGYTHYEGGAGIGGGDRADCGEVRISGGEVNASGTSNGAGIGGGGGGSGSNITITGGEKIEARGGYNAAGIGGGTEGKAGKITITDGNVYAEGGAEGAGIGSGYVCSSSEADITIDGGNITAVGGKTTAAGEACKGAAIGAGGCFMDQKDPDALNSKRAAFTGKICFNGGTVTVQQFWDTPIGTTADWGIENGEVYFNGSTVIAYHPDCPATRMVRTAAGKIHLKEDNTIHQSVRCYSSKADFESKNAVKIAYADDRLKMIEDGEGFKYKVVQPCDHVQSSYEDKGESHDRTCESCAIGAFAENHSYGDPVWRWTKDYTATASFTCSKCKHVKTMDATVTSEDHPDGDHGYTLYTATVQLGEKMYTDTRKKNIGDDVEVITEPTANKLTYIGSEQELVTGGEVQYGEMRYALGTNAQDEPEDGWSTAIPTGKNVGTYYVWYMVKGDDNHNDVEPQCIAVEIAKVPFKELQFSLDPNPVVYTGQEIKPKVICIWKGHKFELLNNEECVISYIRNINAGQADVGILCLGIQNIGYGYKSLDFRITKAENKASVKLEDWIVNEAAKEPQLTAKFGADTVAYAYKQKDAEDSTYTDAVPSEEGEYTVKATIPETKNYAGAEATCDFEITHEHGWGAPSYEWAEDNSTVTATRVCTVEGKHKETETADKDNEKLSEEVTTEPTCEDKGVATYTATFENAAFETQTKTADVPALGHDWDTPKYVWSEDNSEVTATRVCKNNDEHKQEETVSVTSEVTKEPTNLMPGERTYTANFENEAFETQTKTEEIPALINRDELKSAIQSASEDEQATAISADGKDVESGNDYASQEAHNALKQAISEAQEVLNNENATQDEINAAKKALDTAKQTFDNAKQNAQTDKSALNAAISAAKADNDATPDSAAAGSLKPGTETASAEAKQAIANAIAAAEEVVNNPKATQNEIDKATQAIKAAKDAFNDAKETVAVDKSFLKNEIDAAEAAEEGVATSEDGQDLTPGTEYVTPAEKEALDDAISSAKAVLDKEDATQNEINDAVAAMKTAKDTFNAAKKTAEKQDPKPEPTPTPDKKVSDAKPVLVAKGIASGKKAVNISWNKVSGADRYAIYLAKCNYKGKKYSFKRVKVVNANTLKWKKTKLSKKTAYKFYVVAEKKQGSTYKTLAKSIDGHFLTGNLRGKYTNPKSLKLSKSAYTLKKGQSATIKGSVSKVRKGKKLTTSHAATYRYTSNNPKVATVNSKGKITAKGQGTAVIYVQTINGIWKTCKVTVK